jgi:putrescine transport system substrate-binding protein
LAAALLLAAPARAGDEITLFGFTDYLTPEAMDGFTAETGISVIYSPYDSQEFMEAKMLAGHTGYDLVITSGAFLERAAQTGILQPIDRAALTRYGNLDPEILKANTPHDPGNALSVPFMWGTTGIAYDTAKIARILGPDAPLDSWDLIFKPEYAAKLATCGLYMLDAPTEMVRIALHYLGKDPETTDPADLRAVEELLAGIRPHVTRFSNLAQQTALAGGDACAAVIWSGEAGLAQARAAEADNGVTLAYVIPREGTVLWIDTFVIPADAPNPKGALAFLDHLLKPEVIAQVSDTIWFANANAAAPPFMDPAVLADPGIYPSAERRATLFPNPSLPAKAERQRIRLWQAFKAGN